MRRADLHRYKRLLLEKRQELSPTELDAKTLVPAAGGWQGDFLDQANADAEANLRVGLLETEGRLLRAIEDALARIRHGSYGVCAICQQAISKVRLKAVPWTHHCRNCKENRSA